MNAATNAPSLLQMLLGLYGFLLPTLLYVLWSTLALWDLGRRTDLRPGAIWGWTLAIFLLPFIGPIVYLLIAATALPRQTRLTAVLGGGGVYALVALMALAAGVT